MMMPPEDADVAEMEVAAAVAPSPVEYSPPVPVNVSRWYQCALCYEPTTMRCARCKAVRYWFVFLLRDYVLELLCCVIAIE